MSTVTPKVLKFKMIVIQPREADSAEMSDEDKKIKGKPKTVDHHRTNAICPLSQCILLSSLQQLFPVAGMIGDLRNQLRDCLLYTSPSPRD